MRTTAFVVAILLAACSAEGEGSTEPVNACEEAAVCVLEACPFIEGVAECVEGTSDLLPESCDHNENLLTQCAYRECGAEPEAVREAISMLAEIDDALTCPED